MNNNEDPDIWKILSQRSAKHCVIGSFNIDSLGNTFSEVMEWIQTFDILTIQETKLDKLFPDSQFAIDGYKHVSSRSEERWWRNYGIHS